MPSPETEFNIYTFYMESLTYIKTYVSNKDTMKACVSIKHSEKNLKTLLQFPLKIIKRHECPHFPTLVTKLKIYGWTDTVKSKCPPLRVRA